MWTSVRMQKRLNGRCERGKKEMFHSSNEWRTNFLYGRLIKRQINRESFDARSIYRILFDEYDLDLIIVDLRL